MPSKRIVEKFQRSSSRAEKYSRRNRSQKNMCLVRDVQVVGFRETTTLCLLGNDITLKICKIRKELKPLGFIIN